jgi:hypothetical protein
LVDLNTKEGIRRSQIDQRRKSQLQVLRQRRAEYEDKVRESLNNIKEVTWSKLYATEEAGKSMSKVTKSNKAMDIVKS